VGALVPLIALAIAAAMALSPGETRAESESGETPAAVCEGLGGITMGVNTVTLKQNGTMTKTSQSSDGECKMSLTLVDVSSEDNPANKTKSCTVTATPVWEDHAFDLSHTESGDCDTVDVSVGMTYGDALGTWRPYTPPEDGDPEPTTARSTNGQGIRGQSGCNYTTDGDPPHISSTGVHVSTHGWWTDDDNGNGGCPRLADVTVWLKAHACHWWGCRWHTVSYNKQRVRARNLSRNWVNARDYCGPATSTTGYRGVVDVDLVGQWDWWDKYTTPHRNLWCNPL